MSNLKNEKQLDYCYYSKKLNKIFDNLIDLEAEELADAKAKEAKAEAAKAKKADAVSVQEAYKNLNSAKRKFKEDMQKALLKHSTALKVIQDEFTNEKSAIMKNLEKAESDYAKALADFNAKHPEGFHITLKDGDYETTISKSGVNEKTDWISDLISKFFNI